MHPSSKALLQFFTYEHLPAHLQYISEPFCALAHTMAERLEGAEATVCLRKLLEAKDCAVRAAIAMQATEPKDTE